MSLRFIYKCLRKKRHFKKAFLSLKLVDGMFLADKLL